ncbi:histidine-rich glycoprotein [Episyrphus balteatus]|uniref:histidine-rich glycoprotein n=1 Tax=Episyrphus balteatus TaxID=286459 RepID=UPI00248638C7|nr:histidine-rich glycoprotein [Episyrphus balteatus]
MFKLILLCSVIGLAVGLKIHEHEYEPEEYEHAHYNEPSIEETEHHQEVDHKHSATSHQSVKFHHFHAVPVYIKKEDQHLLKNPIEIGGSKQKLKILHPETEKNHNHGLVLENHSESHVEEHGHEHAHYEEEPHLEHYEHYHHE